MIIIIIISCRQLLLAGRYWLCSRHSWACLWFCGSSMVLWFWPSVRLSCRMIRFTSDKDRHVPLWSFCCPTTFWRLKVNGTNAKIFLAILLQMLWFTSGKDQKVLLLPHFILVKFKMFLDGPSITLLHFRGWKINWQKWFSLAVTVPHTIQFTSRRDPTVSRLSFYRPTTFWMR